jgi:hypothetical protein
VTAAATPSWAVAPAPTPEWSSPTGVSSCTASEVPHVVFPDDAPGRSTGPGAIVWAAGRGCKSGAGAEVDPIGPDMVPGPPAPPRSNAGHPLGVLPPLQVATAPHGLIAIAGGDPGEHSRGLLIQGRADRMFSTVRNDGKLSPAGALSTGYLGDLGLLASSGTEASGGLVVEVERWFAHRSARRATIARADHARPVAIAMDYRSDALALWSRNGQLWARDLPASGVEHSSQRLGPAGPRPHVAALLSDDNRAIVLWVLSAGGRTRVFLDYSAAGVRFGPPLLIESFADPDGVPSPAGSPQLVRLSSESVMAAWAGAAGGHWVLRTAPIDQRGMQTISTIAAPAGDALLSALAPGPRNEAILLWTEPRPTTSGQPDLSRQSIMAARGTEAAPGTTRFGAPELVAPPGPVSGMAVAVGPASDRALAVWLGEHGSLRYSVGP